MKKYIIIVALLLSACAIRQPTIVSTAISVPVFEPANPRAVNVVDVEWQVLENSRLQVMLDDAKKQNKDVALFALNTQNYENLSLNMQELKRYIEELQQTVIYYKKETETSGATTPDTTKPVTEVHQRNWFKRLLEKNKSN